MDWEPGILSPSGHNKWINTTLFSGQSSLSGGQTSGDCSLGGKSECPALSLRSRGPGAEASAPTPTSPLPITAESGGNRSSLYWLAAGGCLEEA